MTNQSSPETRKFGSQKPVAIVIGLEVTGLGTVRGLAEGDVDVKALALSRDNNPGRYSKLCQVINLFHFDGKPDLLSEWLYRYAKEIGGTPIVFPTSDVHALMLAKHRDNLGEVTRFWKNEYSSLEVIVSKDKLYQISSDAGVMVPPFLVSPNVEKVRSWCEENPPPYLLKPCYTGATTNTLGEKNRHFFKKEDLIRFIETVDPSNLILMRILKGGDGRIFDCYGLCDREGKIVTLASHRRIRQHRPNFGSTCFGEIPGVPDKHGEEGLFKRTELLLSKLRFHGIFGIEWLQEESSKELYLVDFNARPFSSISHLKDSGVNLPLLAYEELCGSSMDSVQYIPQLKHLFWLDFNRDLMTFIKTQKEGSINLKEWTQTISKSNSFACWNPRDPGPSIYRSKQLVQAVYKGMLKKVRTW